MLLRIRTCESTRARSTVAVAVARAPIGKGQMGSALMGSLQISCFLTGTFRVLPLTNFDIPKSAKVIPFSPLCQQISTFAAAHLVLTPFVRNRSRVQAGVPACCLAWMIRKNAQARPHPPSRSPPGSVSVMRGIP